MREALQLPDPWSSNTADSDNGRSVRVLDTFWSICDYKEKELKSKKAQLELEKGDRNQNAQCLLRESPFHGTTDISSSQIQ